MVSDNAIARLTDIFETLLLEQISRVEAVRRTEIDLAGSFFGSEWGLVGHNDRGQSWRWLGPSGRSHVLLRLAPDSDYLLRVRVQTAAPGDALARLRIGVNGHAPPHQGTDWGADGVLHAWCFIERAMLAEDDGLLRLSLSIRPDSGSEGEEAPEPFAFARQIAFSRLLCEPYPQAAYAGADEVMPGAPASRMSGAGVLDLAGSFFGSEWGVVGRNEEGQSWRWLGPSGRSHVLLRLAPNTDYVIRVHAHTSAPGDVLARLRTCVNGLPPMRQGVDWSEEGVLSARLLIKRGMLARCNGLVRLTLTIQPADDVGGNEILGRTAAGSPEPFGFARQIAFSQLTWEPISIWNRLGQRVVKRRFNHRRQH